MLSFSRARYVLWLIFISIPIVGLVMFVAIHERHSVSTSLSLLQSSICSKPCIPGNESIMRPKQHGTSETPVQSNLRWTVRSNMADQICNYNRQYAEYSGYWEQSTTFLQDEGNATTTLSTTEVTFYDSNTGVPLFIVPGPARTYNDFIQESHVHGWPSFRDDEVNWTSVRMLPNGETVSTTGTHLGHNLPDNDGNRFCINLVCIAGIPLSDASEDLRR